MRNDSKNLYAAPTWYDTTTRLLELPEELLEAVERADSCGLQIKAQAFEEHAYLCTDRKTYLLRNVHQSNSMLLAHNADRSSYIVGSLSTYLEAINGPELTFALEERVEPYGCETATSVEKRYRLNLEELRNLIPMSKGELNGLLKDKMVFTSIDGSLQRIDAELAFKLLQELLIGITTKLVDTKSIEVLHLVSTDIDMPKCVWEALLRCFSSNNCEPYTMDEQKISHWIGVYLLSMYFRAPKPLTTFLSLWKESLPTEMQDGINLKMLKHNFVLFDNEHIQVLLPKSLPIDPHQRVDALLNIKPKWLLEDMLAHVQNLVRDAKKADSILLKHTRKQKFPNGGVYLVARKR